MPILTLGWLSLIGASMTEVVDAAAYSGFGSVSIRITGRRPGDAWEPIVGNRPAIRDLRQRLADHGLRLSNTSVFHLAPDTTLDTLLPALEATVELGSDVIVTTCLDPDHGRWVELAARYAEAAAAAGVRLALEFAPFSEAKSLEAGRDLVERIGAPNLGFLIDSLHLARSGGMPSDLRTLDFASIVFVQLCDAVRRCPPADRLLHEAITNRLYPGHGELPLHDFLDALPVDVEIECETPIAAFAGLPAGEQAMRTGVAVRAFLTAYCADRGRPMWR